MRKFQQGLTPLTESLQVPSNPKAPLADVTNAPHLFGDPWGDADFGDIDGDPYGDADFGDIDGDPSDYGDPDYGDPINSDALALYNTISGDPGYGDIRRRRRTIQRRPLSQGAKTALWATGAGLAGMGLGVGLDEAIRAIKRKRAAKGAAARNAMARSINRQTINRTQYLKRNPGTIAKNMPMPFLGVIGAKLNASPIAPNSVFPADMLKQILDRQNSDTPFQQETVPATYSGSSWTASATGTVAARYYGPIIVQVGINALSGVPATPFTLTATLPLINGGSLVISSQPFVYTIDKGFDAKIVIYPWQIVTNLPMILLGQYDTSHPISVTVSGLPSTAAVTLVVPGSLHPWIIAMRNALNH